MAIRMQWEDLYGISIRKDLELSDTAATPDSAVTCASMTNTGFVRGGGTQHFVPTSTHVYGVNSANGSWNFGVLLNNAPTFEPGQEMRVTKKTTGYAAPVVGTGYDYMVGTENPTTTYEFQVDYLSIVPYLWCFFQKGTAESTLLVTAIPPNGAGSGSPEAFATLFRKMSASGQDSQLISDTICTGLSFTGSENEALNCSATFMGRILDVDFSAAAVTSVSAGTDAIHNATALLFPEKTPLLWQNAQVFIQSSVQATSAQDEFTKIEANGFSLNCAVQATAKRYNSKFATRFSLGAYSFDGSITIPWGSVNSNSWAGNYLKNKLIYSTSPSTVTPTRVGLFIIWRADGSSDAALDSATPTTRATLEGLAASYSTGDFSIYMNTVPQSVSEGGDDETMITYGFTCAEYITGNTLTDPSVQFSTKIAVAYGIP